MHTNREKTIRCNILPRIPLLRFPSLLLLLLLLPSTSRLVIVHLHQVSGSIPGFCLFPSLYLGFDISSMTRKTYSVGYRDTPCILRSTHVAFSY